MHGSSTDGVECHTLCMKVMIIHYRHNSDHSARHSACHKLGDSNCHSADH